MRRHTATPAALSANAAKLAINSKKTSEKSTGKTKAAAAAKKERSNG